MCLSIRACPSGLVLCLASARRFTLNLLALARLWRGTEEVGVVGFLLLDKRDKRDKRDKLVCTEYLYTCWSYHLQMTVSVEYAHWREFNHVVDRVRPVDVDKTTRAVPLFSLRPWTSSQDHTTAPLCYSYRTCSELSRPSPLSGLLFSLSLPTLSPRRVCEAICLASTTVRTHFTPTIFSALGSSVPTRNGMPVAVPVLLLQRFLPCHDRSIKGAASPDLRLR